MDPNVAFTPAIYYKIVNAIAILFYEENSNRNRNRKNECTTHS